MQENHSEHDGAIDLRVIPPACNPVEVPVAVPVAVPSLRTTDETRTE